MKTTAKKGKCEVLVFKLFAFAFLSELWNGGRHDRLEQRGGTKVNKERDRLIAHRWIFLTFEYILFIFAVSSFYSNKNIINTNEFN